MNKIALTAAAFLVATGAAFAGSDNFGSNNVNQPAVTAPANVDATVTGSIQKSAAQVQKPVTQGADRDLFGNH
ncbi:MULTISPECIES: DUF680 domain-containing protein [unclassified Mesorhizobium]|uniref:DUF680 domain-containing protein n=1 Tax=unclassified Mesorhizobium TaxID=325217 RepID=UPI000965CE8F|nr:MULTISPECIES: DUF680 domain-containing protein [unclassified Mesorhizobium]MBN9256634.1 DUF680 domain-containing protein [Mesorhizobium sp.]MBN9268696.1 DUF680 domain-containing protein [Mesorhizobium sp.]OJX83082.1 MAG: hypothetical protein BGO93_20155 [Mesorhizobium sp. 65-26]